jgi:hypothetical protein
LLYTGIFHTEALSVTVCIMSDLAGDRRPVGDQNRGPSKDNPFLQVDPVLQMHKVNHQAFTDGSMT